jgi:hypothetical protein
MTVERKAELYRKMLEHLKATYTDKKELSVVLTELGFAKEELLAEGLDPL